MKKNLGTVLVLVSLIIPSFFPSLSFAQANPVAMSGNASCAAVTQNAAFGARDSADGGNVMALQNFLVAQGYLKATPTGFFGNATLAAVKAFQSANKINATGYVGALTRAAISGAGCGAGSNMSASGSTVAGCMGNASFSSVTGQPCSAPAATPSSSSSFMPGCTSTSGFSMTTGQSCAQASSASSTPATSSATVASTTPSTVSPITVTENTTYSDQTVSPGLTNEEVGSFTVTNGSSESVDLKNLTVGFATGGSATTNLSNLSVQVNSVAVGAPLVIVPVSSMLPVNTVLSAGAAATVNLYATIGGATYGTTNSTLAVNAIGATSGTAYNSGAPVSGQTITFGVAVAATPGTLTVVPNAAYANQNVLPNSPHFKIGSFTIQNTTTEPILINTLQAEVNLSTVTMTDISNFYVVIDGAGDVPVVTPAPIMNFPIYTTVLAGSTSTVDVYASLGTATTGTIQAEIQISGEGRNSDLTYAGSLVGGQTMTLNSTCSVTPTIIASASNPLQFMLNFVSPTATTITQFSLAAGAQTNPTSAAINDPGVIPSAYAAFASGVAHFIDLSIPVPDTAGGISIPVTVTGAASPLSLNYIQYNCGGPTQTSSTVVTSQ